jgi:hypothetical protein
LYEEVKEKQHLSLYEEYFTQFPYGTRQSVWTGEVDRKKELLQDYYHAVIELNKRGAYKRFLELPSVTCNDQKISSTYAIMQYCDFSCPVAILTL